MIPVLAVVLVAAVLVAGCLFIEHDWADVRLTAACSFWAVLAAAGLALSLSGDRARSSLAAIGSHRGAGRDLASLRKALHLLPQPAPEPEDEPEAPKPVTPPKRGKHRLPPFTRPDTRTTAQRIAGWRSLWPARVPLMPGERVVRNDSF